MLEQINLVLVSATKFMLESIGSRYHGDKLLAKIKWPVSDASNVPEDSTRNQANLVTTHWVG